METRMSALFPEISANSSCLLKPAAPTLATHPLPPLPAARREHRGCGSPNPPQWQGSRTRADCGAPSLGLCKAHREPGGGSARLPGGPSDPGPFLPRNPRSASTGPCRPHLLRQPGALSACGAEPPCQFTRTPGSLPRCRRRQPPPSLSPRAAHVDAPAAAGDPGVCPGAAPASLPICPQLQPDKPAFSTPTPAQASGLELLFPLSFSALIHGTGIRRPAFHKLMHRHELQAAVSLTLPTDTELENRCPVLGSYCSSQPRGEGRPEASNSVTAENEMRWGNGQL